jgi:hypothetical protein
LQMRAYWWSWEKAKWCLPMVTAMPCLASSMAVAFPIPATCNLQQDNWESHLQHKTQLLWIEKVPEL